MGVVVDGGVGGGRIGLQPITASLNFNEPTFDSEEGLPETKNGALYEPYPNNAASNASSSNNKQMLSGQEKISELEGILEEKNLQLTEM